MTFSDALARFTAVLASVQSLDTLQERLCEACRLVLDADGAVITSETVPDGRTTVAWTQLLSRRLESLQDSSGEGPLIESLATGEVVVGDFSPGTDDDRWPALRREIAALGFTGALIAIPLRSELALRGVLMAHREGLPRRTDPGDARFLGAAVGTAVLQNPAIGTQSHVFAEVLPDRDVVHRATHAVEVAAGVRYEDALALLRAMAFARGEELGTVAAAVVDGRLTLAPPR
ncbi:GAF and ANTAR domain-containing protein [Aeromicrobium fastidiosum]|uniref:GAF and ANTAR domain-containing protein n=1 Tax=Aeromicrobium fastidiosum TaxID=52699 RepID=UPI00202324F1|nr:GAF and ANTAR domain-containing protein [Aeromicrobium fastidiosum]MCL8252388.1 GAF and ANTAR domain-containing protein [Aeromicrobium fastidiosum]